MSSNLRFQAMAAIAVGSYPVFLLLGILLALPTWSAWALMGLCLCAVITAMLQGSLLSGLERKSHRLAVAAALAVSLCVGGLVCLLCRIWMHSSASITAAVLFSVIYYAAWLQRRREPEQMVTAGAFFLLCTLNFLTVVIAAMYDNYPAQGCFIILLALSVMFGSLRSQMSLLRAAENRNSSLDKQHLRHNFCLYGVLAAVGLLIAAFGRYFVTFSKLLLQITVKLIARCLQWLAGTTDFGSGMQDAAESGESAEEGLGGAQNNEWLNLLLAVIVLALLVLVLYRNRQRIGEWFRELGRNFVMIMRRIFGAKSFLADAAIRTEEYADYVQSIAEPEKQSKSVPDTVAKWRKQYRNYRRMPESTEKFRFGYALWLASLQLRHVELQPSDTPDEICAKAVGLDDASLSARITEEYYIVRYALRPPQPDAVQTQKRLLEQTLKKLRMQRSVKH